MQTYRPRSRDEAYASASRLLRRETCKLRGKGYVAHRSVGKWMANRLPLRAFPHVSIRNADFPCVARRSLPLCGFQSGLLKASDGGRTRDLRFTKPLLYH